MRAILAFLLVMLCGAAATAQPITKEIDRLIGGPEEARWETVHRSVQVGPDGDASYPIVGPVEYDGRTLYAVRGDLLTLDTFAGRVTDRQQYPGPIQSLDLDDGQLFITMDVGNRIDGQDQPMRVPYIEGSTPGRGLWDRYPPVGLRARAEVPAALVYEDDFKAHTGDWKAERATLEELAKRDLTNPMLTGYLGLAAHLDGDKETADAAFDQASATVELWPERLQLCGILERAQRGELAAAQCAKARETMIASGVRPEAMLSLVAYVVMSQDLRFAMQDAFAARDAAAVDRIAGYTHEIAPNVEGAFVGWRGLSIWLAENGKPDLAKKWEERATAAESSPVTKAFWGKAREVDLALLITAAVIFTIPLAGLIAGLRRREDEEDWKPRPSVGEVLVALGLMLAMVPVTLGMRADVGAIGEVAAAPLSVLQEGYGSPTVTRWLEDMPATPARDELLEYAKAEHAAASAGRAGDGDPPDVMKLFEMVDEVNAARASDDMMSFDMPEFEGAVAPNALPLSVPGALLFLILATIGRQVRIRLPKVANGAMMLLPGSHAGALAPVVLATFLAALLFVATPVGTILQSIAMPSFGRYFGFEALVYDDVFAALYPMDRVWPWVALIVTLAIHVLTTRRAA